MLRVGLTGELGSGKSTVAAMLSKRGAIVLSSDEMGSAMMQPGQPVFQAIVRQFGPAVVNSDGTLNRSTLAALAFDPSNPRVEELNAIVHPAVLTAQAARAAEISKAHPHAILVVESALIFATRHATGRGWAERFDCIALVTAPEEQKIERFVRRAQKCPAEEASLRADAARRLAAQRAAIPPDLPCYSIVNGGSLADLERHVERLWKSLVEIEATR
jgi:dephospho-CoA kinase